MAIPTTRAEFKGYCLRALGDGVLQINVSDAQVEDRIDEAIYLYQQQHMDAVVRTYISHQITGSTMRFANATGTFQNNELIRGATTNTTACVTSTVNSSVLEFYTSGSDDNGVLPDDAYADTAVRSFADGEVVMGVTSGATATVSANGITFGDMDNRYFALDENVIAVVKVYPPFDHYGTRGGDILFDVQAQFNMSMLGNFSAGSLIPYAVGRQYQQMMNDMLRGRPGMRFQRHMGRLFVDIAWHRAFYPGRHILIEGYRAIDPDDFPLVWSDKWLQRYAIAVIKRQWGMNLSKYSNVALPGGVHLDGPRMLGEANQEVKDLEDELESTFQEPPGMIVG